LVCAWLAVSGLAGQAADPLPVVSVEATDDYASEQSPPGIKNTGLFTLSRTGDVTAVLTVQFTLGGTATPGVDYGDLSGAVTFPAGAATVNLPVEATYSRELEPVESVELTLLAGATYALGVAGNATVNIWPNDYDDPAPPTVVVWSDGSGGEHVYPGGFVNTVVFTVYRGGPTNLPLTIDFALGGTAVPGVDYTGDLTGSITIPAGSSLAYLEMRPVDDDLAEGYESILLTLVPTARYHLGGQSQSVGEVIDNDSGPIPAINQAWLGLAGGRLGFKLNGTPGQSFRVFSSTNLVDWSLATSNAIPAGGDFIEPAEGAGTVRRFFRAELQ
jgi:Calx-beta domain